MELDDGESGNAIQLGGDTAPAPPAYVNHFPVLDRTPNICAPPKTYTTILNNPTAPGVLTADPVPLAGDTGEAPTVAQETETKTSEAAVSHAPEGHKDKKRKKDKALVAGGLAMKKKKVPSLVEKWQKVQKEVERGASKH